MARKKRSGLAEDIMELVALMPWWAGCALALVSYVFLHGIAQQGAVATGKADASVAPHLWRSLAYFGQYLVPVLCLAGAAMSAHRRRHRENLVAGVAGSAKADALEGMSWQDFEKLVGEAFRLQGYQVSEAGGSGPDGGVDLVLRKDTETFLVQCKQWKAYRVGVTVVREFYGVMAARGAAGGFVVTSGRFTDDARAFAEGRSVKLIDGPRLFSMIKQAKAARATGEPVGGETRREPTLTKVTATPACPVCGKAMVLRTASRGKSAGSSFWGCSGFPACRGTRMVG